MPRSAMALRILVDGDSIAAQCLDEDYFQANGFENPCSWAEWANVVLSDRLRIVENKGVGGQRSGQILARIADSLAVDCDGVFLSVLTNDLFDGTGTTVAQMKTNMAAIYDAHLARGRFVVHLLPGPSGFANAASLANQYEMHRWLQDYARTHPGIFLVNAHAVAADPADGLPISYYARPEGGTPRGVHPGYLWAAKIGQEVAAVIEPLLTRVPILESPSNADPRNVLTNGKMLGSVSGLATGYSVVKVSDGSAASGIIATKVARSDGRPGEVQQFVVPSGVYAAQGPQIFIQDTTPGGRWNVGDVVRLIVHFETDPDTAGSYLSHISLTFWNNVGSTLGMGRRGVDVNLPAGVDALPRKGAWRTPWKAIPSGTARLQVRIPLPAGTTRILSIEIQKAV